MAEDNILTFRKQLFGVRMSYRYHRARQGFFELLFRCLQFVSVLSGLSVFASAVASAPNVMIIAGSLTVAIAQGLMVVMTPEKKAAVHEGLADRFNALETRMAQFVGDASQIDAKVVQEVIGERLQIENMEPPPLTWLIVKSRNDQIAAQNGVDSPEIVDIPIVQRILIQIVDILPYERRSPAG